MFGSLQGTLLLKDTCEATVVCGGVGYRVQMSHSDLNKIGPLHSDVFVWVSTHMSQDALRLFGFLELAGRYAFEVLIGANGVGPKLALAVLSALSPHDLAQAVSLSDKHALTQIPGIGAKKAERMLIDLRDKLSPITLIQHVQTLSPAQALHVDLYSALRNLGFSEPVAETATQETLRAHPKETDIARLVREALQSTTRDAREKNAS